MIERCDECRFWLRPIKGARIPNLGECRYNPPEVRSNDPLQHTPRAAQWPLTYAKTWCGKFATK